MRIDELNCDELEKHAFRIIKRIGKEICKNANKRQFVSNEHFSKMATKSRCMHPSEGVLENASYWATDFLTLQSPMYVYWCHAWFVTELYHYVKTNQKKFKERDVAILKMKVGQCMRSCFFQTTKNLLCDATEKMHKSYGFDNIIDAAVETGHISKKNGDAMKETMHIFYDEGLYDKLPL